MIFKRDPALWMMLGATLIRLVSGFLFPLSVDQQSLLNAFVAAIVGVLVAFMVRHDGQVAAIGGLFAAALAVAIGFGLRMSPENQALVMSGVGLVVAAFARTQMGARVPPVVTGPEPVVPIRAAQA